MSRVITLVGNLRAAGRTTHAAELVAAAVGPDAEHHLIELSEIADDVFQWGSERVTSAVGEIMSADVVVVATPTYKGSYTGLLKSFLDHVEAGALRGVVCIPVMLGGAPQHALAVEVHLRPLLVELGATVPTPGLFLLDSDPDAFGDLVQDWLAKSQVPKMW